MIYIFQRHCNFSSNSTGKVRPDWFSREGCFKNLVTTIDGRKDVELTIMFDGKPTQDHFINNYNYNKVLQEGGTDGHSFLNVVDYVKDLNLKDTDIVYFLEDDYMHVPGWVDIMKEGFTEIMVDYITLYDHKDKYFLPGYDSLQSKIIATSSIHWRTAPSTTNTYACRFKTFLEHIDIHRNYCDLQKGYTRDHDKFLKLWEVGSNLVSCIPGYSTHVETPYLSPVVDWEKISYI
jgi:hypothetical protein